jgi:hypothetical protein
MARRRYRSDALSAAGRGVKPDEAAPSEQHPLGSEPTSPSAPAAAPEPEAKHEPSSLAQQIAAMRQQAQPDPLDQFISFHFQGALPNERAWLRANPHNLQNPMLVHHAAGIALQRGIPRQSPEFLQFISALLNQHYAAMQAHAAPAPPPVHEPMPPTLPEPEHAAHIDVESHDSEPQEPPMSHYAAPVSHGSDRAIEYEPSANSVRLSKAEIEHAEAAGVSVEEYGRQKLRMQKMQKSGLIK